MLPKSFDWNKTHFINEEHQSQLRTTNFQLYYLFYIMFKLITITAQNESLFLFSLKSKNNNINNYLTHCGYNLKNFGRDSIDLFIQILITYKF